MAVWESPIETLKTAIKIMSWAQRERVVTVFFIIFQERQKVFSFFFKANPRDVN